MNRLILAMLITGLAGIVYLNHLQPIVVSRLRSPCRSCNVAIIDIDILRADALSCYGYYRNTTPNLCALARKGVLFEKNFSQANWTLPSLFSTFTSVYPRAHRVKTLLEDSLSPEIPTMAELFKQAGYKTYWVGAASETSITAENGGKRGFDKIFTQNWEVEDWKTVVDDFNRSELPYLAYFYTEYLHMPYLVEKDDALIENLDKPDGFPVTKEDFEQVLGEYLVENYQNVFTQQAFQDHPELFNNVGPDKAEEIARFFRSLKLPTDQVKDIWNPEYRAYSNYALKRSPEVAKYIRMMYDTKLKQLDQQMGQLLKYLTEPETSMNTIIVVTSDHGEEFGEHGNFSHEESLYNELIHVPLIIFVPRLASRRINEITQNIDILPTLMEIVNIEKPIRVHGQSLWPLMNGRPTEEARYAVSEKSPSAASIQDKRFKLILPEYPNRHPVELYDLNSDPGETSNLSESQPEQTENLILQLRLILENAAQLYPPASPLPFPTWVNPEKQERLRKEGYF